jgi:hypothetical protein
MHFLCRVANVGAGAVIVPPAAIRVGGVPKS